MRASTAIAFFFSVATYSSAGMAGDFEFKIPLSQQQSGNFYIDGTINSDSQVQFLVDTGAGMVILADSTFKSLKSKNKPTRRIAARLADGRTKAINVYELESLVLGEGCNVGPLEVAVIPGASNNILGLNVLNKAAPFAIYTSPPALALSVCSQVLSEYANVQKADSLTNELAAN